jgi:SAM-dependent methyltransferase
MYTEALAPPLEALSTVDRINRHTMSRAVREYEVVIAEGLNTQERAALELVGDVAFTGRILDLGMGAGRTVRPLRSLTDQYVGVDYTAEMVEFCRQRFRGVRFEHLDARALSAFEAQSFDLVFFSCNGISMVDHAGRLSILSEAMRVLAPGGAFVFSTCNRNSWEFEAVFQWPGFERTLNPLKWGPRIARFVGQALLRTRNRWRLKRHEVHTPEYVMLNDVFHHYSTMIYYIDLQSQVRQLNLAGFARGVIALDQRGRRANAQTRDGTLIFVSRKPK